MKYKLIGLLILWNISIFSQEIEKIEPPFWYANMKNTELQILCYGENISSYSVALSKGKLIQVRKTENPNYLFILMDTKGIDASFFTISFLNENNKRIEKLYELKKRKKNSHLRKGFDSSDVLYLIMPDRFANGNEQNDSCKEMVESVNRKLAGGRHGGDIEGIINHIDYLKGLGVTTLWSTPLLEDNEPVYSYHTYAQSNFYKIDPRYGTNEDYQELAKKLHINNMKLVMDYVTNHWGSKHWMIKDLPTKDWIHFWDNTAKGFKRSNYRMTTQFGSNASEQDKKACVNGWFDTTMPDINQRNSLVLRYITQNAIWWIEYADLDGLRVDTYSYNDKEAIAKWTQSIMEEYPNFNIVGEVWMHNQAQISYWQKDSKIGAIESFNSNLPSVMDFTLHDAILKMFDENENWYWDKGLIRAYENFVNDYLYPNSNNMLVFAGNHDTNRINDIYRGDIAKYKLIITLIASIRGIPQLYYGDEIGMLGNRDKNGDGDIRKDFPGGWKTDNLNAFKEDERTQKQSKYFNFTKKVLNWRQHNKVIHYGRTKQFIPVNNVYVYFRYTDEEMVMIVINNSKTTQKLDLLRFNEMLKSVNTGIDIISNTTIKTHDFPEML